MEEKKKGNVRVVVFLVILVIGLAAYIGYDKVLKNDNDDCTKEKNSVKVTEQKTDNKVKEEEKEESSKNLFTDKSTVGNYKIYMNSHDHSDSIIVLYEVKNNSSDKEHGSFAFVAGGPQDFSSYESGYYQIEDSKIKFYGYYDENKKKTFINQFQITDADLKVDNDGTPYVYFDYSGDKIVTPKVTYDLITK